MCFLLQDISGFGRTGSEYHHLPVVGDVPDRFVDSFPPNEGGPSARTGLSHCRVNRQSGHDWRRHGFCEALEAILGGFWIVNESATFHAARPWSQIGGEGPQPGWLFSFRVDLEPPPRPLHQKKLRDIGRPRASGMKKIRAVK